ncbi:CBS domain-containing protein [Kitasatospora sp. NPDC059571]|uniref:CBS domain-containing protein n=1 Tax=Kitasatospora sp. NPDC059571 TaxID=3346871 RepID=UPI0036BD4C15
MRVADLMTTPPVTVTPSTAARDAARLMAGQAVGSVLVAEHGTLHGVLTDRDLVVRLLARDTPPDTPVSALMTERTVTVGADEDLTAAYRVFRRTGVRRLPVLDGTRLVGVLTIDDLFLDVLQRLADLLGPVSSSALREGGPTPAPNPVV